MSKKNRIIQSRTEVLNHYLEQIEDNEPLTVEQEQALGRRLLSGDYEARNELIEANLHFVLSCAIEMSTPYVPIEELVAAGNYGLTLAATRYDPSYPTQDEDEDNWSRDLIDRIPASPQADEIRSRVEETKEQLRSFLSKWYYPSDVQLLMDLAQMMYDGYTVSDLAKKHGLPVKRMKSIIDDLQQKALLYQLQTAFQKAA